MKKNINIHVKYIEQENAYRVWGEVEGSREGIGFPGLDPDIKNIPYAVREIAKKLIKKEK